MVRFRLGREEDSRAPVEGWPPPVDSEGIWAIPLGDRNYRIENVPWFAQGTAFGDVVSAVEFEGNRWVMNGMAWSGHLTVRVACPDPSAVLGKFADLGVRGESAAPFGIAALDIPPDADLHAVVARLRAGGYDYEEACVTDEWRGL